MTDKRITVDNIRWHSVLPWLHLLRAMQLALRIRVVLVALCAVVVFGVGEIAIRRLPFHEAREAPGTIYHALAATLPVQESVRIPTLSLSASTDESRMWLVWPWITVAVPANGLFQSGQVTWSNIAARWTELLWAMLVWAIFGGAIARMHAVRFARDESVSPGVAVRFLSRLWSSYLYGPLLPMLGVGGLSLIGMSVGALDAWLGGGRGSWLSALGWLPVLASLVMAMLLIVLAASWPLMVAAISVEGSDGFDGLSRAFGYVMNRLWSYVCLVGLAFGLGVLLTSLLSLFFHFSLRLAEWSIGGHGELHETRQFENWYAFVNFLDLAVLVSYFWSATTVIYFLLRQSDDGTPLDQVYIPGPPPKAEPLPLVGVAASQQPVIERPVTEHVATDGSPIAATES